MEPRPLDHGALASELPAFDVVAPSGERITVRSRANHDVGDLLRALGRPGAPELHVDGRRVTASAPVPGVLRHGSVLSFPGQHDADVVSPSLGRAFGGDGPSADADVVSPWSRGRGTGGDGPSAHADVAPPWSRGRGTGGDGPSADADVVSPSSRDRGADGDEPAAGVGRVARVAVTSGPACASAIALAPGRHWIGRAPGSTIDLHDALVEPHHGLIEVSADGDVHFTQLTGRLPTRLDGRPTERRHRMESGTPLLVGASAIEVLDGPAPGHVGTTGSIGQIGDDPSRRVLRRGPAPAPPMPARPLDAPAPAEEHHRPSATGLVGAAVAIVASAGIGFVLGHLMFALFAAVGALASFATWGAGWLSSRRRRRRSLRAAAERATAFRTALRAAQASHAAAHRHLHPTLVETLEELQRPLEAGDRTALWCRRRVSTRPPITAVVGVGDVRWTPVVDARQLAPELEAAIERASVLRAVGVPIDLESGSAIAVQGALAASVVRAIVVQLAVWYGPSEWELVVVTDDRERWSWVEWLPHARGESRVVRPRDAARLEAIGEPGGRLSVVVVDDPIALSERSAPLRRSLARAGACCVAVVSEGETPPGVCDQVLTTGATGAITWWSVGGDLLDRQPPLLASATGVRATGVDGTTAERVARRLAVLVDPEDADAGAGALPDDVALGDIHPLIDRGGRSADDIARAWGSAGSDPAPSAPIGVGAEGIVRVDLVRDGPHGLIAGTTGAGKSELLRTLVVSLAAAVSPQHLAFVLVDYKGGATFDRCVDLPHTVGVVTDLDGGLAERALISLEAELQRREHALRDVGAADLTEYRSRTDSAAMPRLVVIVDEFAALAHDVPQFLTALLGIAQRGRSLGVHLLLATQRPAGVVSDDIRANTNLRLALRLTDAADARDVVGDELPSRFTRDQAGRSAMRLGADDLEVFQAAHCARPASVADDGRLRIEPADLDGDLRNFGGASDHDGNELDRASAGVEGVDHELDRAGAGVEGVDHELDRAGAGDHDVDHRPGVRDRGLDRDTAPGIDPSIAADTELVHVVASVREAAELAGVDPPKPLWCEPLPRRIARDAVERFAGRGSHTDDTAGAVVVGVVDDPVGQRRLPLTWQPERGNLALIGSRGSGTTSTLLALVASIGRSRPPSALHVYAIDAGANAPLGALDSIEHAAGVVGVAETERLTRLVGRLDALVDRRSGGGRGGPDVPEDRPDVLLLIDGLPSLRAQLADVDGARLLSSLDRILVDGPAAGVATCFTADGSSVLATSAPAAERWVFHLHDPAMATAIGVRCPPVPADLPGRLRIASSGLEAQVVDAADDLVAELAGHAPRTGVDGGPPPLGVLPDVVRWSETPPAIGCTDRRPDAPGAATVDHGRGCGGVTSIPMGLSGRDLTIDRLALPWGDHVFIGGLARTGKTTALQQVVRGWSSAVDDGVVVPVDRHSPLALDALPTDRPTLVVVDDADRVDDVDGRLRAILDGRHPTITLAVAGRLDAVRSSYGHWTREVARSRCGLIMTAAGEIDGELLGVTLPSRTLVPPRPGLGWLVDIDGARLVQVALAG